MTDINSLCEEWEDDERMRVMFAPLRSKELNPESWNSKIQFWETLIKKYCLAHNVCSISMDQLETVFTRDGTSPHCLEQVVAECVKRGEIIDTARYKQQLVAQGSWSSWVKNIGWKAVQVNIIVQRIVHFMKSLINALLFSLLETQFLDTTQTV